MDRWGGCYLHCGAYVMYVSEQAKAGLLRYSGKAMRIKVLDLSQPVNPGDALITRVRIAGPAKETAESRASRSLRLVAEPSFGGASASFRLTVSNAGTTPLSLQTDALSLTVLMKGRPKCPSGVESFGTPGDGPSCALVTRAPVNWADSHGAQATPKSSGAWCDLKYAWHPSTSLPSSIVLAPGESREMAIALETPPGEYELFFGYGGGVYAERSYTSNSVLFDVAMTGEPREVH